MTIEKRKQGAQLLSDLHFTTKLSLEACAERISQIDQPNVFVDVQQIDSDNIVFALELVREGMPNSRVRGTLRRWQGTLTRLDCNADLKAPSIFSEVVRHIGIWFMAVVALLGLCGFWAMGVSPPGDFNNVRLWIEWFWWWFWIPITAISIGVAWFFVNRGLNKQIQQGNVDADRMLQSIMRVFADADISQVERDTSHLTQHTREQIATERIQSSTRQSFEGE